MSYAAEKALYRIPITYLNPMFSVLVRFESTGVNCYGKKELAPRRLELTSECLSHLLSVYRAFQKRARCRLMVSAACGTRFPFIHHPAAQRWLATHPSL